MKLGLLVECNEDGAEHCACSALLPRIAPKLKYEIEFMGSKKALIEECADAISILEKKGCDRFLILWDEMPAWPDSTEKACLCRDRDDILKNLGQISVPRLELVCARHTIESWLLSDEIAVAAVLSTKTYKAKIATRKKPDHIRNPKGVILSDFEQHRGRYFIYDESRHPGDILQTANLGRLRRSLSFRRFEERLLALNK